MLHRTSTLIVLACAVVAMWFLLYFANAVDRDCHAPQAQAAGGAPANCERWPPSIRRILLQVGRHSHDQQPLRSSLSEMSPPLAAYSISWISERRTA